MIGRCVRCSTALSERAFAARAVGPCEEACVTVWDPRKADHGRGPAKRDSDLRALAMTVQGSPLRIRGWGRISQVLQDTCNSGPLVLV